MNLVNLIIKILTLAFLKLVSTVVIISKIIYLVLDVIVRLIAAFCVWLAYRPVINYFYYRSKFSQTYGVSGGINSMKNAIKQHSELQAKILQR